MMWLFLEVKCSQPTYLRTSLNMTLKHLMQHNEKIILTISSDFDSSSSENIIDI